MKTPARRALSHARSTSWRRRAASHWLVSGAILIGAVAPRAVSAQAGDTLKATEQLKAGMLKYMRQWAPGARALSWPTVCDADRGQQCVAGAIPNRCPDGVPCQPSTDLAQLALDAALAHPDAGFITGFATFALINTGRQLDAFKVASGCQAADWWCALLRGYVFHAVGRLPDAERAFREGLTSAPDSVRCALTDASWAVGDKMHDRLQRLPCSQRAAVSDSIWWLADPSYASAGNERWTEQVARLINYRFTVIADLVMHGSQLDRLSEQRAESLIPRGQWDSWRFLGNEYARATGGVAYELWTSKKGARYHFVPELEGDDLEHPAWQLEGSIKQEGYTPPTVPFYEIPAQIARFRHGDSMMVAIAGDVSGTVIAGTNGATAYLVMSDAPESFPLRLSSPLRDSRAVFLAQAAGRHWVTSLEVFGERGMGRHRVMLQPLPVQGPGVSDVLLYSPVGPNLPDTLRLAAGMMLGDTAVSEGGQLGLYWETYGAPEGTQVGVELEMERTGGGLMNAIRGLVPGLGVNDNGRPAWAQTSPGLVFRRAVVLDLSKVDAGGYTLVVRTSWPGQEALETRRDFVVR